MHRADSTVLSLLYIVLINQSPLQQEGEVCKERESCFRLHTYIYIYIRVKGGLYTGLGLEAMIVFSEKQTSRGVYVYRDA